MGLLSPEMKAELRSASRQVYWLLALALPAGTVQLASSHVSSTSLGSHAGRVISWGTLARTASDRSFSLAAAEISPEIEDQSGALSKAAMGAGDLISARFLGSAATIKLASPNVTPANWLTFFSGYIDQFEFPRRLVMSLRLRSDDRRLRRYIPKALVSAGDWPYADPIVRGQIAPLLYGKWDSGGEGGAIPCPLVHVTSSYYLVCAGWAKAVDRVYVGGTQQTSGWTVLRPLVNGRRFTLISFTTPPAGAVTADAQGYDANADGTGALIENPADQIKHFLVNWVFGDYKSGSWLADATAPVDTTWFSSAATFLSDRGHKGSRRIAGQPMLAIDAFNEWTASLCCRSFWTGAGKLAVRFEDHGISAIYLDDPWIVWDRHLGEPTLSFDSLDLIDSVSVQHARNEVNNQYTQTLSVSEPSLSNLGTHSLPLPWSYAGM